MKELFTNIVNVQLGTSIAIGLLLMSHSLLKRRYVAKLRYWLWLVVAVRLLVPVDINIQLDRQAPVAIPVQEYYVSVQQPEYEGEATQFEIITAQQLNLQSDTVEDAVQQTQQIKNISVTDMLYRFWLMVAVGLLGVSFLSYRLAKRDILSTAVYDENLSRYMNKVKGDMGIDTPVRLAVCSYTGSPMLMGIIKPVIVLPDTQYTQTELEMILRHELTHLRRRDILYKMMLHIVACVYWFNPLMYFMSKYAGQDIEFSCDEDTVKQKGKEFKAEYARTIVKVITMQNNRLILATTFSQNAQTVKERFTNIFFGRRLKKGRNILAGFMAVVVMVTTMVGCGTADNSNDVDNKNTIINNTASDDVIGLSSATFENSRVVDHGYNDENAGLKYMEQPMEDDVYYFNRMADNGRKYPRAFTSKMDKNGNITVLCNKAGCSHTDENCNAYDGNDYCTYFMINGQLYGRSVFNTSIDKNLVIYKIDENGKQDFIRIDGYVGNSTTVVTDGKYLYLTGQEFDFGTNEWKEIALMKISLADGSYEIICNIPQQYHSTRLLSVSDDGKYVVFTHFLMSKEDGEIEQINAIDTTTGSLNTIKEINIQRDISIYSAEKERYIRGDIYFEKDRLYIADIKNNNLRVWYYGDTEETVLLDDLHRTLENNADVNFRTLKDNKFVMGMHIDDGTKYGQGKYKILDLDTITITDFNLVGKDVGGFTNPVPIQAEFSDRYLIITNFQSPTIADYAIISKTDFFNSTAKVVPVGSFRI